MGSFTNARTHGASIQDIIHQRTYPHGHQHSELSYTVREKVITDFNTQFVGGLPNWHEGVFVQWHFGTPFLVLVEAPCKF